MARDPLDAVVDFVTTHNLLVVVLLLVLTAGIAVGMTNLDRESSAGDASMFPPTTPADKADYIADRYAPDDGPSVVNAEVYVRATGENALSKQVLVETLRYQRAVAGNASVRAVTPDGREPASVASLVATRLAGDANATLAEQLTAMRAASDAEVAAAVRETLGPDSRALTLLPNGYEPGTATAESHRLLYPFAADSDGEAPSNATAALFGAAGERAHADVFTLGEHAMAESNAQLYDNTMGLIVPLALALILGVLAVTYRDVVDVFVGMVGVVVAILWMFGILGWLGVSAGITMIIGPVLVAGLSIDYGFHVFTHYREQRGDGGSVAGAMARGLRSVAFALALVTATAAIGFLSNVVNPLANIRALGIGITLGVVSSFVVFLTLVPALKVTVDGALERLGLDRRKAPLGDGAIFGRVLGSSVVLARRFAPVVVVIALVAGASGAVAWTTLEEKPFEPQTEPAAEWKTELPGPMGWEEADYSLDRRYVQQHYRSIADDRSDRFQVLVEGDVTADGTLDSVSAGIDTFRESADAGGQRFVSPVSVVQSVAAQHDAFAETVARADTDGDGVPDERLDAVFDHLYEVAPERASLVVERTDGAYESLRVVGPADGGGTLSVRAENQRASVATIEAASADLTATAVSESTVMQAGVEAITDGILRVMVLALGAVSLAFVLVSRAVHGSASLGAVTVVPIVLVTGLVVGGMALLSVPLTLLTALLMSLVIGLGIDYNIHVADRFARELAAGHDLFAAIETAVTSTGGALLGSALTTSVAFASITLHPTPQLQNFGTLVVLAMVAAFAVSVFVLPSLLALWGRYVAPKDATAGAVGVDRTPADD